MFKMGHRLFVIVVTEFGGLECAMLADCRQELRTAFESQVRVVHRLTCTRPRWHDVPSEGIRSISVFFTNYFCTIP
jgi:hypothetical protein